MKTSLSERAPAPAPPGEPAGAWAAWDRFWFKPADPTILGFIRLCAGAVVLYVHLAYTFGLLDYVGPEAWLDTGAVHQLRSESVAPALPSGWFDTDKFVKRPSYLWSIYFHVTDPFWIYAIHTGILLAMLLFVIGLWTRVTSVLTCIGSMCYLHRAPTTLFGMDTMMNLLLIYLMIGPSGAALSLDRWLKLRQERKLGRRLRPPEPQVSANFALRLMQVNFCIIYLASGTSKLLGPAWWNGTAIWGTVANYSFAPMSLSWYYNLLVLLAQHRWLWELVMSGGAVFTLVVEIGLPFLIWQPRLRWWMVCGSVLLHTGIGLTMGLVTFSLLMLCLLFAFIPPEAVHYLLDSLRGFFARSQDRAKTAGPAKERKLEPARAR